MICPRHPDTETNLTCGRCESPVCPKCLVYAPVGVRCPECARPKRLPTYELSSLDLMKALFTGLGIGVALAILFGFFSIALFRIPFLPWIALVGIGYVVGEGVSLSVNRKRGRALQIMAAVCVLVSFIIIGLFSVVGQLVARDLLGLFTLAAAIYIAVVRVGQ